MFISHMMRVSERQLTSLCCSTSPSLTGPCVVLMNLVAMVFIAYLGALRYQRQTAADKSVLVVMNGRRSCSQVCYQASLATKWRAQTLPCGPLGLVMKTEITLLNSRARVRFDLDIQGLVYHLWVWQTANYVRLDSWVAIFRAFGASNLPREQLKIVSCKGIQCWSHDVLMVLLD